MFKFTNLVLLLCISVFIGLFSQSAARDAIKPTDLLPRIKDLFEKERHADALPLADSFLAETEKSFGVASPRYVEALALQGEAAFWAGDLAKAEKAFTDAQTTLGALGVSADDRVTNAVNFLGLIKKYQGKYPEADDLYQEALRIGLIAFGTRSREEMVAVINNLADLNRERGRFSEAVALHQEALQIRESLEKESLGVAETLNNLGLLYHNMGDLNEAKAALSRASSIRAKLLDANHPRLATTYNNLGLVYLAEKDYQSALPNFEKALGIWRSNLRPMHPRIGIGLHNTADAYRALEQYEKAEPFFLEAIENFKSNYGAKHPNVATALNNIGQVYRARKMYDRAIQAYEEALQIWTDAVGPHHPRTAVTLTNIGQTLSLQQKWSPAIARFKEATEATIVLVRAEGAVDSDIARQRLIAYQERFFAHVRAAKHAADESGETTALATDAFLMTQWANRTSAATSLAQNSARYAKGDEVLAAVIRRRQNLAASREKTSKELNVLVFGPAESRNDLVELSFRNSLQSIDAELAAIDRRLSADFPEYIAAANPTPLTIAESMNLLRDDEALIVVLITPDSENFLWVLTNKQHRWVRIDMNSAALGSTVDALRCGLDVDAWTGAGRTNCSSATGKMWLGDPIPLPFDVKRAHDLYETLFGKVEDLIAGKRLMVVTSGALSNLPFHVLAVKPASDTALNQIYRTTTWLGLETSITVLPSVASLKALRLGTSQRKRAPKPFLGFGNPRLDGDEENKEERKAAYAINSCKNNGQSAASEVFVRPVSDEPTSRSWPRIARELRKQKPLPNSARELCLIAKDIGVAENNLDTSVWLGREATEGKVKMLSKDGILAQHRIVHFATHALTAKETHSILVNSEAGAQKEAAEPALVLTPPADGAESELDDGLLTATEIAQLNMNAEWVVMSACNTAARSSADAEALSGLARAFFYAGARSLLVSHWSVDTKAAETLTTHILSPAAAELNGRGSALRSAMQSIVLAGKPRETHPSYWAPFVVVGDN
jgi:CHAT domain-containing protein/tetratricopeptide (TPR) repeat protein